MSDIKTGDIDVKLIQSVVNLFADRIHPIPTRTCPKVKEHRGLGGLVDYDIKVRNDQKVDPIKKEIITTKELRPLIHLGIRIWYDGYVHSGYSDPKPFRSSSELQKAIESALTDFPLWVNIEKMN